MDLLATAGRRGRRARFACVELIGAARATLERIRGARLAMIFQDPMTSLTPHLRVGDQISELVVTPPGLSCHAARDARRCDVWNGAQVPGRAALPAVSARIVGRHASARDDRDRARL